MSDAAQVEALAEVLGSHQGFINYGNPECLCGFAFDTWAEHRAHVGERLAAFVAAREDAARAEALREAAEEIDGECPGVGAALTHPWMAIARSWLLDRAALPEREGNDR